MQRLTPQEFYTQKQYRELDKHGKRMDAFTYYDMLDFAEAYAAHVEESQWVSSETPPERNDNGFMESVLVELEGGFVTTDVYRLDYSPPEWFNFRNNVVRWRKYPTPPKQ